MSSPEPESYSKDIMKSINPTLPSEIATTLSQDTINRLSAGQASAARRSQEYDLKLKAFEHRQKLYNRVIQLRRELLQAEKEVQDILAREEPTKQTVKKGKAHHYGVKLVKGKMQTVTIVGDKE